MQDYVKALIDTHSNCIPLIIGDMNATIRADDRTSKVTYQADRMYREFLLSNNLCPSKEETCRPWTHYQATGRDVNNNTIYTFSRIDDIILPSEVACKCPPCTTHELGSLSDHVPLIANIPPSALGIHIPFLGETRIPCQSPQKILVRPVSDTDRTTFAHSLQDPAHGVPQKLEKLLQTIVQKPLRF